MLARVLAVCALMFVSEAAYGSVFSETWCKLQSFDLTSEMKNGYLSGSGSMYDTTFDAEMRNQSSIYAITEIEIKVTGTYDGRSFERLASKSMFLEPGESERVFFTVDTAFAFASVKLERWTVVKVLGCNLS
jgi:hypothetical protein